MGKEAPGHAYDISRLNIYFALSSIGLLVVILGLDGTGPESFQDIFRFVRDSGLYDVQITYLTPFPGTPLYRRLSEEGRLLAETATERCTLFDINFQPDGMTVRGLEDGFRKLAARLYHPRFVAERSRRFKAHLRSRIREKSRAA